MNEIPSKKQRIILTVASKHLGHVTFYTVDIESGLMHSNVGKNFYARKKFQCSY